jgi:uncharacterized SAM-binding protein YcdF (DUF218 family)
MMKLWLPRLKKNGYKSILLITSKWHSKRAYLTFRSALKNDGIKIVIQPSKYDTFRPDVWWKNRNDAKLVFDECQTYDIDPCSHKFAIN